MNFKLRPTSVRLPRAAASCAVVTEILLLSAIAATAIGQTTNIRRQPRIHSSAHVHVQLVADEQLLAKSNNDRELSWVVILAIISSIFSLIFVAMTGSQLRALRLLERTRADSLRDASERQHAEESLRHSEERSRLALDAGRMGAWEWDMQANVQHWDAGQYELFGLDPATTVLNQETFFNLVHPDDLPDLRRSLTKLLNEGGSFDIEFRICKPDGTIRWLAGKGRLIQGYEGQPLRMIGVNFDITDRKQSEEERNRLLQAEKAARTEAETANRIKDEFLATLSHELRSPLNAMLGWLTLLRTRQLDSATVERALETVERNARMQAQLVEDLLDVSRIIRGQLRLAIAPVKLHTVIEAAIDTVRPAADAKNIYLHSQLDTSINPTLGDSNRLQQIIWNLLTNAIKFTPSGGAVEVRLEVSNADTGSGDVEVRSISPTSSKFAQITVTDTGKGIAPDFLPYVFDRFRQADSSITRSYGGLGLGLAIVRHLTELHGGTVSVKSDGEGCGAKFTVTLPLKSAKQDNSKLHQPHSGAHSKVSLAPKPQLEGLTVLVVDDETDARELLVRILEDAGAIVAAASNAEEAIALLNSPHPSNRFDLLISDIGMPQEDGYTLLRRIRLLPSECGGQLPALALTAYAREEDRQAAYKAGFQAHMAKPVEPDQLVTAIATLGLHSRLKTSSL
jgi:PAS domain S-box-containing protein